MGMVASRSEVYLVRLNPTKGRELRKTRPCLITSPDDMNRHIAAVIVAPMTTKGRSYPTRISVRFQRKTGEVVLDQICTVDKNHLIKRLGKIDEATGQKILALLAEMFAA